MELKILNPLEYPGWDELLLTHENYSFFHTSAWARVLCESYGYKPLYFTSIENGRLSALIPVMEVNSFLTGRRGVSLPFTDFCEPIVPNKEDFQEIIEHCIKYGKNAGWRSLEWRGGEPCFREATPSLFYIGHTLDLIPNEQKLLSRFRSSTKRNIKKAIREGVDTEICNSLESVKAFYQLHCKTRKHHGLPPQPYFFFNEIYEHIISPEKGVVVLASYQKRIVAGAVYLHLGDKVIFKFGASNRKFHHLRPNNLVMWEAIRWYAKKGSKILHLGRAEPNHIGLIQFKSGWALRKDLISYYKYGYSKNAFVKDRSKSSILPLIFRRLPAPLLNAIGVSLYKHIG